MTIDHLFQPDLLNKYNTAGPRYTSYPTAVQFNTDFTDSDFRAAVQRSNQAQRPLSLYVHLPFCDTVCFFCGCNKIITKNRRRTAPYLERLFKEMAWQGQLFDYSRPVKQLHWGGGTPTFLSPDEMQAVMQHTAKNFHLLPDDQGEYSIEIDPREANADTIFFLRTLGFNRLSMGVQDFDAKVQKAVNRLQPLEITTDSLYAAREAGFRSISLDLIYGLPLQTEASFSATMDIILKLSPDRLSVFNYAHLPHLFKTQKQIHTEDLPSVEEKLRILKMAITRLTEAGYVYIGMDHFAKPNDELSIAQQQGTLYRNFQGYSTHADCDLVGLGISSISQIDDCYTQNQKEMGHYEASIDQGHLPLWRGVSLTRDDVIRRYVITQLMCNLHLDWQQLSQQFSIDAQAYFTKECQMLQPMAEDGLLEWLPNGIRIADAGRLLIRNIVMVFDAYLPQHNAERFSRVI